MVQPGKPIDHDKPRSGVWAFRFPATVKLVAQSCSQAGKLATRMGLGILYDPATVREVPAGPLPTKIISLGLVKTLRLPLPIFHSPKEMVLLVPSVTL